MTPLIGISGRQIRGHQYEGTPAPLRDAPIDLHWAEYAEKVAGSGATPVQLPMSADPVSVVERLDGLVLSGGTDVQPQRYGATPGPELWLLEPDRDEFELALIAAAVERELPILGICRGIQILNVFFGGTIIAHLKPDEGEGHSSMSFPRHLGRHALQFEPGSQLADMYGASALTNSFHHQGIDRLADGLSATARSSDGVIEGAEHNSLPIIGIQWHPEMMQRQEPIWGWLAKRATTA